jgi:hypothetical protein
MLYTPHEHQVCMGNAEEQRCKGPNMAGVLRRHPGTCIGSGKGQVRLLLLHAAQLLPTMALSVLPCGKWKMADTSIIVCMCAAVFIRTKCMLRVTCRVWASAALALSKRS